MPAPCVIPSLPYLPRLRAVLRDVLGIEPAQAHLHLDDAEALACDDRDRTEVIVSLDARFGIAISRMETAACETVADLLRLVAAKHAAPRYA
jgi:acyl carrier protein